MANHKSSAKRVRQSEIRRIRNRYVARTTRNVVRKLYLTTDKAEAQKEFPRACSMLDKLAKRNIIHDNKASNLKSKLARHINSL